MLVIKLPHHSLKKWALYLLLLFIFGGGVGGFALLNMLSKDVDHLNITQDRYHFDARRDSTGMWHITAKDPPSLWFAFGYVQTLDREFQLELFWHIAVGRLSELVGESQISRDRIMRMSAKLAHWDWDHLPDNSLTKQASLAFLEGRKNFLSHPSTLEPIEYRALRLERATFDEWQPWELSAMIRFHTWEFSYDFTRQSRLAELRELVGPDYASVLMPIEDANSRSLYQQQSVENFVQARLPSLKKIPEPKIYKPVAVTSQFDLNSTQSVAHADTRPQNYESFDIFSHGAGEGASNAWLIADPVKHPYPTLCNDTHLGFSWPSPLYPVAYRIESLNIDAQGFMLPGVPAMIIGTVNDPGHQKNLAWGITMASYADTQDLISLSPKTLNTATKHVEKFLVKNLETKKLEEKSFTEEWTDFGPRIDNVYSFGPKEISVPLALDWLGFRETPSISEFFLRRNLYAQQDIIEDFASRWTYPAVNFTWIEKDKDVIQFGHHVTGLLFKRDNRNSEPILSEGNIALRSLSQPSERPYFRKIFLPSEKTFLVTANQKVFKNPLAFQITNDWGDSARAEEILAHESENLSTPAWSQSDWTSLTLKNFLRTQFARFTDEQLCPNELNSFKLCHEITSELRTFDGAALSDSWMGLFSYLWLQKVKQKLWPATLNLADPVQEKFFSGWSQSTSSSRMISHLITNAAFRARWEQISHATFDTVVLDAYHEAWNIFSRAYSNPRTAKWGNAHRILWQHLFSLAPPPVGPILAGELLGDEKVPAGLDSPGRYDFVWKPSQPLEFPTTHGAASRMCVDIKPESQHLAMKWAIPTGVSGNPFSKWSHIMPRKYYFRHMLYDPASEKVKN